MHSDEQMPGGFDCAYTIPIRIVELYMAVPEELIAAISSAPVSGRGGGHLHATSRWTPS